MCITPSHQIEHLHIEALSGLQIFKSLDVDTIIGAMNSNVQSFFDITHTQISSGSPAVAARQIQKKLGESVRTGLSVNVPLAHYAASKSLLGIPNVLAPWDISHSLQNVELKKLNFVQKILLQRLALHGVTNVNSFIKQGRHEVSRRFGQPGLGLFDTLNGQDYFSHKTKSGYDNNSLSEYLILPPNTKGRKVISRYLKQVAFRLSRSATRQGKFSKTIQLSVFFRKQGKNEFNLSVNDLLDGKSLYNKFAEKLNEKIFNKFVLAIELKMLSPEHLSGQGEFVLERAG